MDRARQDIKDFRHADRLKTFGLWTVCVCVLAVGCAAVAGGYHSENPLIYLGGAAAAAMVTWPAKHLASAYLSDRSTNYVLALLPALPARDAARRLVRLLDKHLAKVGSQVK